MKPGKNFLSMFLSLCLLIGFLPNARAEDIKSEPAPTETMVASPEVAKTEWEKFNSLLSGGALVKLGDGAYRSVKGMGSPSFWVVDAEAEQVIYSLTFGNLTAVGNTTATATAISGDATSTNADRINVSSTNVDRINVSSTNTTSVTPLFESHLALALGLGPKSGEIIKTSIFSLGMQLLQEFSHWLQAIGLDETALQDGVEYLGACLGHLEFHRGLGDLWTVGFPDLPKVVSMYVGLWRDSHNIAELLKDVGIAIEASPLPGIVKGLTAGTAVALLITGEHVLVFGWNPDTGEMSLRDGWNVVSGNWEELPPDYWDRFQTSDVWGAAAWERRAGGVHIT